MKASKNGSRFKFNYLWEHKLHQPYDYRRKGLLNRILSNKIYDTKNPILKAMLNEYERVIVFWFNYADILSNFKNYRFRNR